MGMAGGGGGATNTTTTTEMPFALANGTIIHGMDGEGGVSATATDMLRSAVLAEGTFFWSGLK